MIKSIGLKQRSGTVSTANIHPRQTSPLTWKIQLPTQGVVHGAPHHKENKAKGSGKQRNQTQQRGKEHPNRVSTGGYVTGVTLVKLPYAQESRQQDPVTLWSI